MEEPMSWKNFSLKKIILLPVALMLILISASGCTPEDWGNSTSQSAEQTTLETSTAESGSLVPAETGEAPAQTEKPSASGTDVVWTPFV